MDLCTRGRLGGCRIGTRPISTRFLWQSSGLDHKPVEPALCSVALSQVTSCSLSLEAEGLAPFACRPERRRGVIIVNSLALSDSAAASKDVLVHERP